MKILYIASSGGPGGASEALSNLIQGVHMDSEISVVFRSKGSFFDKTAALGVRCYHLPAFPLTIYPPFGRSFQDNLKFPYRIVKYFFKRRQAYKVLLNIVKEIKPDIIHTNVGPLDIGFRVARKLSIKHVWHLREYQDLDFGLKFFPSKAIFKEMLKEANNHSIAITRDIFKYWELDRVNDAIVYDGVISNNEHSYLLGREKYFLFAGRIEDAKGVKDLIKVFGDFAKTNSEYNLFLAGKGSDIYIRECRQMVKELFLENRIFFLGFRTDIHKLMEKAKALVVASRFEGFGFITTEAMSNHCLVIGKNTAGTKEQFDIGLKKTGNEIGLRFDTRESLLSRLQEVVDFSDEKYKNIVDNAYEVVKEKYTIAKHVNNIILFYNKILNDSK